MKKATTGPPLEKSHNWRQVSTNMYARNFLEVDNNPLYCRVDMAGELSGITAKELPVFNYLIYGVALIFGYDHWYGRLINLIVSSFGIFFFYLIVRDFLSKQLAFIASFLLMFSLWFMYSRKIIPDTFSTSLVLGGIYFGLRYLYKKPEGLNIVLYCFLAALGTLNKIPASLLLSIFLLPVLDKSVHQSRKLTFIGVSAIVILLNGWYYGYWIPHIVEEYKYVHHGLIPFSEGVTQTLQNLPKVLNVYFLSATKSVVASIAFLAGLYFLRSKTKVFYIYVITTLLLLIFILKAGYAFYLHEYYIVPYVPVIALVTAIPLAKLNPKWAYAVLLVIAVESIANQQHDFFIKNAERYKLELEAIADSVSNRDDRIAMYGSGNGNPQTLYFTHRKGWIYHSWQLEDPEYIQEITNKGCQYLFIDKRQIGQRLSKKVVFENEDFIVYRLAE